RHKDRENFFGSNLVFLPSAALGIENSPPLRSLSTLETQSFPKGTSFFGSLNGDYSSFKLDPLTKNQLLDLFSPQFLEENGFLDKTDPMSASSIYTGKETVSSGYIMADYDVSENLKLVAGLRNEYTSTQLHGKRVLPTSSGNQLVTSEIENNYNALLPMFHLKYKLNNNANLRGAFTRTFVRPNFGDMTPGTSIDVSSTPATISQGNAELKPSFSHNFDVMGEYFFQNVGILTGGIFYKHISDVIFTDISMQTIDGTDYRISQAKNLNKATLLGLEFGVNRRFDFLQGFWKNFGVEFNYSYVDSETKVPRIGGVELSFDKTALPNQSEHLFNAILFYEGKGVMVRLAGNYRGKSIETIDQKLGQQFYKWTDNNFTLDATATVSLSARVKAFLELNNLTNSAVNMYMGDSRRISSREVYGSRGQAGIRWEIIK
ncbi:TonB-dependent receptor domain-containing protein, partial [Sphingobacterium sp.]|uniref:TonB-dependent receptor domain-containing protein n=1 Tax=Sphingobacterium sp. TaxID=341027 RepID=UPI0028A18292